MDQLGHPVIQDLFNHQWVSPPVEWTSSNGSGTALNGGYCTENIIGGYNFFAKFSWVQNSYSSLPAHYAAIVTWRAYFIDSWDNEDLYLDVDGVRVYTEKWYYSKGAALICGISGTKDVVFDRASHIFPHISSTMTIKFSSSLDEDPENESYGIKSIQIILFPCDSTCNTCTGPSANDCTSCSGTRFLNPLLNSCLTSCPANYYKDSATNKCVRCYQFNKNSPQAAGCNTCDGPNSNNCLSCYSDAYYDAANKKCLFTCPAQQWTNPYLSTCSACYAPVLPVTTPLACYSCSGSGSTNCLSCYPGVYFNPFTSTCVSTCPSGYYGTTADYTCHRCYTKNLPSFPDESCLTCFGPNSNECQSCASPLLLDTSTRKCVPACPIGWYADSSVSKCFQCYQAPATSPTQSCYTCNSNTANSCLSCFPNATLNSLTNSCVLSCPAGWWRDITTNTCKQCYQYLPSAPTKQACETCSGGESNNCLSCNSPYFLDPTTGRCGSTCPESYWEDTANKLCSPCYVAGSPTSNSQSCKTCSGNPTACSTCYSGIFFHSMSQECLLFCPTGWYGDSTTYTCVQCYQGTASSPEKACQTCNGSSSSDCLSCQDSSTYLYQGTCLDSCPPGTYPDSTTMTCKPCFQGVVGLYPAYACLTCNGPNSNNCLSCSDGYYFYPPNSTCLQKCPLFGWYSDSQNNTCSPCYSSSSDENHRPCLSCNGPAATNCLTCNPYSYLFADNGTCLSTCPLRYYTSTGICVSCAYPTDNSVIDLDSCVNGSTSGSAAKAAIQVATAASSALPAFLGGASTAATLLIGFLGEINIFVYINVGFPANFVVFIEQIQGSELVPNPFEFMKEDTDVITTSTIGKFEFWGTNTVMLDNSGVDIAKNLIVLTIGIVLTILAFILSGKPSISRKIAFVRNIFVWNMFLSFYLGDFDELFMSSIIQMRENNSTGKYATFSLALSSLVVISYVVIIFIGIYLLNKKYEEAPSTRRHITLRRRLLRQREKVVDEYVELPSNLRVLSEDFKVGHPIMRSFLIILTLQSALIILLVFSFQDVGLAQAIAYTAIAIALLIGVAGFKPFKSKIQTSILIFNQLIKIVMGMLATILGIDDFYLSLSSDSRTAIGSGLIILIIIGVGANALMGLGLIIQQIVERIMYCLRAYRARKERMTKKSKKPAIDLNDNIEEPEQPPQLQVQQNNFLTPEIAARTRRKRVVKFNLSKKKNQSNTKNHSKHSVEFDIRGDVARSRHHLKR